MSEHFIRIACPSCRKRLRIKSDLAGKTIRCPNDSCGTRLEVPEAHADAAQSDGDAAQSNPQDIRVSSVQGSAQDSETDPDDLRVECSRQRGEVSERWSRRLQRGVRVTRKILLVLSMFFSLGAFILSAPTEAHDFSAKSFAVGCVMFAMWIFLFLLGPDRFFNPWWEDLGVKWKMGTVLGLSILFCFSFGFIPKRDNSQAPLNRFAEEFMSRKLNESDGYRSHPFVRGKVLVIDGDDRGVMWWRFMSKIPPVLKPKAPEDVGTVFVLKWDKVQVGQYIPGDGKAYRHCCVVKTYDVQKTMMIGKNTIWGSPPPKETGKNSDETGDKVPDEEVLKYLDECFRAGQ